MSDCIARFELLSNSSWDLFGASWPFLGLQIEVESC